MTGKTSIEWATQVWNPTSGCTRVSDGCTNCYAFTLHDKRYKANLDFSRLHVSTKVMLDQRRYKESWMEIAETLPFKGSGWMAEARRLLLQVPYPKQYDVPFSTVQLLPERLDAPMRFTKPERIFVDSMSDLFHEKVPIGYIADVFNTMASVRSMQSRAAKRRGEPPEPEDYTGPEHQYLILTKRPERMREIVDELPYYVGEHFPGDAPIGIAMEVGHWPLPNVWLGASVEDQAAANERIPHLLATPAAVRFLSCEPLLGPVVFNDVRIRITPDLSAAAGTNAITWVIIGGESGPRARPMDLAWARSLVAQCRAADVAPFVKQLGATAYDRVPLHYADGSPAGTRDDSLFMHESHGRDMDEWPEDLRIREFPR